MIDMKNRCKKRFLGIFIFLAVFAASAAVLMLLWNWLIPAIFGGGAVGYWQATGLLLMAKILFGGFRGGQFGFARPHGHHGFPHNPEVRERVKNMSPDERREYIRAHMFGGMHGECGNGGK